MKGLSLITPIDPKQLEKETLRIYEVCDGCRRCFNLSLIQHAAGSNRRL